MKPSLVCLNMILFTPLFAPAQTGAALDTGFIIVLSRNAEPAGIVAGLTTTSTYPCEGYQIRTRVIRTDDTLTIYINGFVRPAPCFQTSSTATGNAFLGSIPGGICFLRLSYRGESDTYKLIVSNKTMQALPLHSNFTELQIEP